jgi:hypothetical protein
VGITLLFLNLKKKLISIDLITINIIMVKNYLALMDFEEVRFT